MAIELGAGKRLVFEARRQSPANPYIQSATWNGKPYTKAWFRHADITGGGTFVFEMDPNTESVVRGGRERRAAVNERLKERLS